MTTTTTTPVEILNKGLKFAVDNNNCDLVQWIYSQGTPTNAADCLKIAIEKGNAVNITYLSSKVTVITPTLVSVPMKRNLNIVSGTCTIGGIESSKNSEFLYDLHRNAAKAYHDLKAGMISVEEINYKNSVSWAAIHYLTHSTKKIAKAEEMLQLLLDQGADGNLIANDNTPLTLACSRKEDNIEKVVEILLAHPKINVNYQGHSGWTALMMVCNYSTEKVMEMLLKHPEIDLNLKTSSGRTILHLIQYSKVDEKIVDLILNHPKLDVNIKEGAYSALMLFCLKETEVNKKVVETLLMNPKTDLNVIDVSGETAFRQLMANYTPQSRVKLAELFFSRPDFQCSLHLDIKFLKSLPDKVRQDLFLTVNRNHIA